MNKGRVDAWKQKLREKAPDIAFWCVTAGSIVVPLALAGYIINKEKEAQADFIQELENQARDEYMSIIRQEARRNSGGMAANARLLPMGDGTYMITRDHGRVS